MRRTLLLSTTTRLAARWAVLICVIATIPGAASAQSGMAQLREGTSAAYKMRHESALKMTVNGREQKEGLDATIDLRVDVAQKNQQGQTPVKISVQRVQAKATRFKSEFSLDTKGLDAGKPITTTQFVSLLALSQQPLELLYEKGKLAQVAGAGEFAAKLEQLLKKDFEGSEEYQFASPVYAASATDEALRATWKNVVVAEIPTDAKAGEPWEEVEDFQFTGDVPSEAWLGLLHARVKTTSRMKQETDGSAEIKSQFEAGQNEARRTKLGPNDFSYEVNQITGTRAVRIDNDGLIRDLTANWEIKLTGKLEFGNGIPIELTAAVTLRIERATATP